MKQITLFCSALTLSTLLATGNSALAEPDTTDRHSPLSVGFELNKTSKIKYVLDASNADFLVGSDLGVLESDKESMEFDGEEALLRIGFRISPVIEFHGILGSTKAKEGSRHTGYMDFKSGLLFGAGVSATPPSSTSWKSVLGLEVTRASIEDTGLSLSFRATDDGGLNYYATGTGSAELQLTKIDLSALAIYKTGFTEPYIGLMYSIVSGSLKTKLRGTAVCYAASCPSDSFTLNETRDVSLDSQMGLTLGFNAQVADTMNIGFGAIAGTRTQYSAHVEYSF